MMMAMVITLGMKKRRMVEMVKRKEGKGKGGTNLSTMQVRNKIVKLITL